MADDRELWERIRAGDAREFDLFYRQCAPHLQRFLRQLVGSPQAAEDVTHESFLQLWRRPNGFRPEGGSLRAYLFGIARKRAAEWWRQRKPERDAPMPEEDTTMPEAAGHTAPHSTEETRSLVGDAFSRLDADERTLLWLREVEGQSYAELAQILEVPLGTVRSRLFDARENLRRIWHSTQTNKIEKKEGRER
jgi:RNA polymerase sigma-70 factor (ECF subfamily)